jgi:hypothetical protein
MNIGRLGKKLAALSTTNRNSATGSTRYAIRGDVDCCPTAKPNDVNHGKDMVPTNAISILPLHFLIGTFIV